MRRAVLALLVVVTSLALGAVPAVAQTPERLVRLAVARLTHGHVGQLLGRGKRGDVELVGIYEPDRAVAARYVREFKLDPALVHAELGPMLDRVKPDAVAAFGSVAEHRSVVEAAAPRRLHVMVEKPLSFDGSSFSPIMRRPGIPAALRSRRRLRAATWARSARRCSATATMGRRR